MVVAAEVEMAAGAMAEVEMAAGAMAEVERAEVAKVVVEKEEEAAAKMPVKATPVQAEPTACLAQIPPVPVHPDARSS